MLGRYQHPAHFLERNWKYVFSPPPVTSSFLVGAPGAELIWTNCSPMPQRTSVAVTPSTAPTSSDKASGLVMVYPLRSSEARGVGNECVSTCRSRWSPSHENNKITVVLRWEG